MSRAMAFPQAAGRRAVLPLPRTVA